jgi:hypothetical protein
MSANVLTVVKYPSLICQICLTLQASSAWIKWWLAVTQVLKLINRQHYGFQNHLIREQLDKLKLYSAFGSAHRWPFTPSCNAIEDTDSDPPTLVRKIDVALSGFIAMAPTCFALTSCPPLSCCWSQAETVRKDSSRETVTSRWNIILINIDPYVRYYLLLWWWLHLKYLERCIGQASTYRHQARGKGEEVGKIMDDFFNQKLGVFVL